VGAPSNRSTPRGAANRRHPFLREATVVPTGQITDRGGLEMRVGDQEGAEASSIETTAQRVPPAEEKGRRLWKVPAPRRIPGPVTRSDLRHLGLRVLLRPGLQLLVANANPGVSMPSVVQTEPIHETPTSQETTGIQAIMAPPKRSQEAGGGPPSSPVGEGLVTNRPQRDKITQVNTMGAQHLSRQDHDG